MTRIACAAAIAACLVACDGRAHIDTSRTDGGSDAGYPRLLFADIQYGTSCVESPGCTPAPLRDICGIHRGDVCPSVGGAARVSCDIVEVTGSDRTVTFSADQGGDFSISVSQAVFGFRGGGASGGGCTVAIVDGPSRYTGQCGSSAPSTAQPCQITNVRFYDDMGNPTVEGDIYCQHLPNEADPLQLLEVHQLGASPANLAMPGRFRIANCDGLEIPRY